MYTRRFQSLTYVIRNIINTHTLLRNLGGISGGTIASVMNVFAEMTMKKAVESADPFFLAPRDKQTNIPIRAAGTSHCTCLLKNIISSMNCCVIVCFFVPFLVPNRNHIEGMVSFDCD